MLEDAEIDFNCPNCEKKITIKIKQVGGRVVCSHCKSEIELVDDGVKKAIKEADKAIDDLFKKFK